MMGKNENISKAEINQERSSDIMYKLQSIENSINSTEKLLSILNEKLHDVIIEKEIVKEPKKPEYKDNKDNSGSPLSKRIGSYEEKISLLNGYIEMLIDSIDL